MASSTAVAYQFMPWARRGLTVALTTPDTLGAGALLPARATAPIGVTLAGANAGTLIDPLQMNLHGPGDVTAIDTRLVLRTDPKANARNFEPNYLAIVDFDPPDFPWLLTPASANGDDRLRPWLVLVVLDSRQDRPAEAAGARHAADDHGAGGRRQGRAAAARRIVVVGARAGGDARDRQRRHPDRPAGRSGEQRLAPDLPAPARAEQGLRRLRRAGVRAGAAARPRPRRLEARGDGHARPGLESRRRRERAAAGLLPLGVLDRPGRRLRVAGAAPAHAERLQEHARRRRARARRHGADGRRRSAQRHHARARGDDGRRASFRSATRPAPRPNRSRPTAWRSSSTRPPTRSSIRSATAARTPPASASRSSRRCTATGT